MALRGRDPNSLLEDAFTTRLQVLALRKQGFSAAKNLQSGLRYLERLGALPTFITERHRLQVQAIGRMACGEELPRVWATMDHFTSLGEHRVHWAWGRVFFAVGMAITMCLRVSDVATLRWGWLQYPGWFVSTTKSTRQWLPNQSHHFGKRGGDGFGKTAATTTVKNPPSFREDQRPYTSSNDSSSRGRNTNSAAGTLGREWAPPVSALREARSRHWQSGQDGSKTSGKVRNPPLVMATPSQGRPTSTHRSIRLYHT